MDEILVVSPLKIRKSEIFGDNRNIPRTLQFSYKKNQGVVASAERFLATGCFG